MYSALSTFSTTTEVPLSKAPNPQLLPGRRSINGCPLLRPGCVFTVCVCSLLCVCTWMGKCRAQILSMGHHTWLYVTSLHFTFPVLTYRLNGKTCLYISPKLKIYNSLQFPAEMNTSGYKTPITFINGGRCSINNDVFHAIPWPIQRYDLKILLPQCMSSKLIYFDVCIT